MYVSIVSIRQQHCVHVACICHSHWRYEVVTSSFLAVPDQLTYASHLVNAAHKQIQMTPIDIQYQQTLTTRVTPKLKTRPLATLVIRMRSPYTIMWVRSAARQPLASAQPHAHGSYRHIGSGAHRIHTIYVSDGRTSRRVHSSINHHCAKQRGD